jgi:hypothetical protein
MCFGTSYLISLNFNSKKRYISGLKKILFSLSLRGFLQPEIFPVIVLIRAGGEGTKFAAVLGRRSHRSSRRYPPAELLLSLRLIFFIR